MGDLERTARARKVTARAFWWLVLGGSIAAIGVGFAGGRTYGTTALRPPAPIATATAPPEIVLRDLPRALYGAGSFDAADDQPDPYGDPDRAVAARIPGWAPRSFDPRRERARVAVVVVDADFAASAAEAFAAEPLPLAFVVTADRGSPTLQAARAEAKTVLVACEGASLSAIAELRRGGAAGIACSTGDRGRSRDLVRANRGGIVVDDLEHGDGELYRAARAAGAKALTRDVVADARDEPGYVDFLFAQAGAIARRTGAATVAIHARAASRLALERFAARAERDGIELVDVASLAR